MSEKRNYCIDGECTADGNVTRCMFSSVSYRFFDLIGFSCKHNIGCECWSPIANAEYHQSNGDAND